MEYYFYVILIFAIVLKLTVYLCWYQVKRSSATREVRIIMPDGTTRCAVISARGWVNQSPRSEERQNLPQAESLAAHDNQGMVECPVQPRYGDALNPQGQLTGPPEYSSQEWKLPKYEEVTGMPPPYTMAEPEATSAVQPVDSIHPVQAQISGPPPAYPGNTSFPASAYSEPSVNESSSFPPQPPTASPVDLATLSSGPHITVPQSTIPSTGHQS
ncbi:uncharacterized protein LOC110981329 [Acanthaster planci]|uniref:Uncharacterized protein LOC110981329 n=1 Tax=Acanthaster planci TaxID=133434 RepID=A0A8B7YMM8_ACAPL|nr:uncharacterized protein LOC110981329 [Acanthaster planci]